MTYPTDILARHWRMLGIGAATGAGFLMLAASTALSQQSPCGPTTTVQSGDTFFAIAERCDVSVSFIQEANPGVNPNNLQIGQTLQLTAEAGRAPQPEPGTGGEYRVEAGDTAFSIAQAMGISVEALLEANPDLDPYALRVGQMLLPPAPVTPAPPGMPAPGTQVSGVLTGEGVECQAMRGHDGQLYTLVGELGEHREGDVVQVSGDVPEVSFCQQGTTIEVDEIRSAG